jgi:hypothetical protein
VVSGTAWAVLFRRREQLDLADPLGGILRKCLEQADEALDEGLDVGTIEQLGGVFEAAGEALIALGQA